MVVGGTETTSNTVEWAMAEMLQNRRILRKVQEELDAVVGVDGVVEESHLPQLHYLQLVVKEALRLHPALPLMVPHHSSRKRETVARPSIRIRRPGIGFGNVVRYGGIR